MFQDALSIAGSEKLKAVDAIHVAFAVKFGCQLFVTTDPHFRDLQQLPIRWIDLSQTILK